MKISVLVCLVLCTQIPTPAYNAAYEIILDNYGLRAVDYFSKHVKAIDGMFYFRDSSPTPENFLDTLEIGRRLEC